MRERIETISPMQKRTNDTSPLTSVACLLQAGGSGLKPAAVALLLAGFFYLPSLIFWFNKSEYSRWGLNPAFLLYIHIDA